MVGDGMGDGARPKGEIEFAVEEEEERSDGGRKEGEVRNHKLVPLSGDLRFPCSRRSHRPYLEQYKSRARNGRQKQELLAKFAANYTKLFL